MPDIEQKLITDWLDELGYSWELVKQPEARFNIAIEYPREGAGYMHAVSARPDRMAIMRGVAISEEHRQALAELGTDGFHAFRFALLRDLLRLGDVTYRITGDDASQNKMEGILLQQEILAEDLTRSSFLRLAQRIYSTSLLIMIHVRHAVGQMP